MDNTPLTKKKHETNKPSTPQWHAAYLEVAVLLAYLSKYISFYIYLVEALC
jgi:hypothetical protein